MAESFFAVAMSFADFVSFIIVAALNYAEASKYFAMAPILYYRIEAAINEENMGMPGGGGGGGWGGGGGSRGNFLLLSIELINYGCLT